MSYSNASRKSRRRTLGLLSALSAGVFDTALPKSMMVQSDSVLRIGCQKYGTSTTGSVHDLGLVPGVEVAALAKATEASIARL